MALIPNLLEKMQGLKALDEYMAACESKYQTFLKSKRIDNTLFEDTKGACTAALNVYQNLISLRTDDILGSSLDFDRCTTTGLK